MVGRGSARAAAGATIGAVCALALVAPGAASAAPSAAVAEPLTGQVLVTLRPAGRTQASAASMAARVAPLAGRVDGPVVPQIGMVRLTPPRGVSLDQFLTVLRHDPAVRSADLERRFGYRFVPNDPALVTPETAPGTPPGVAVEWWPARLNLFSAWDVTRGDGVRIAVIDSGIDASLPEFAGKIVAANLNDSLGDGDAGVDEVGHGTHVAGLACAAGNNGIGLVGAGFNCGLIIEKSDLSEGSVAAEIVDAANRGANVINMSFGTDGSVAPPAELVNAIQYAIAHNVVLVAAASDESQPGQVPVQEQGDPCNVLQPAGSGPNLAADNGLCVTSANYDGTRSNFSGTGTEISLAAFGAFSDTTGPVGIFSTFPYNTTSIETGTVVPFTPPCTTCRTTFMGDTRYAYLEGTSMATPMVAGIAGLVHAANPGLSAPSIVRILKETATRPPGGGYTADLGWGIVNAGAAVAAAEGTDGTAPVTSLVTAPKHTTASSVHLTWKGADVPRSPQPTSGIAYYLVYRIIDHGAAKQIAKTTATSLNVRVSPRHLYGWYVLAVDKAGNREAAPPAITHTRVLARHASKASARR